MNCIDVQRLIMPFINGELSNEELGEFIHHIKSCPNCMEELEVYYVLIAGMRQLDEEKELSNDFHKDLISLIRESEDRILHNKMLHIRKRLVLLILIFVVAVISSFRIGEFVVEDMLNKVKVSNYLVNDVFLLHNPLFMKEDLKPVLMDPLPEKILSRLYGIYEYLYEHDRDAARNMVIKLAKFSIGDEEIPHVFGIRGTFRTRKELLH